MKNNVTTIGIYTASIIIFTVLSIIIGSELITQYKMYSEGYTGIEQHYLADDMGFGLLLMFGLIPEIIIGIVFGYVVGKKINAKFNHA